MAQMSQDEVDAWIAAHGGGSLQHGVEQKRVPNPTFNPDKGVTPSNPQYVDIEVETWTNGKTTAKLTVKHQPDGSWDRIEAVDSDPSKPAATAQAAAPGGKAFTDDGPEARENGRRWGWNPETKLYDRDLGPSPTAQEIIRNRSLPADQDPRAETDAERNARAKETIARQGQEAQQNKGTTVLKPDGKGGTIAVTTYPDGRAPDVKPVPGVPSEVAQRYGQVKQDPQTGAWSGLTNGGQWEPIAGGPGIKKSAKMPPGVTPPSSFEYGTAATKLAEFWRQLNEAVSRGDITGEDAAALFAPYHQQAESAVSEQTGILNTQRGIMQDQTSERGQDMTQANTRATVASGLFNNSMANFTKLNDYLPAGSDAGGQAFLASLKLGQGYVDGFGGLKESPRTPFLPAVEQAMQATLPSGAPNLGASAQAATNTFDQQAARLTTPAPAPAPVNSLTSEPVQGQPVPPAENPNAPVGMGQPMLPSVQATMNGPDPSMVAGNLLALGFDPDVVDAVHQQRYGRSMYGRQAA